MPGSFKTEAVVLRSIRFGEADRVLHLYTRRSRARRRGGEGRAAREVAPRRAARAAQPGAARPAPGPRRALHDQPGRHGSRPRGAARAPRLARARARRRARRCCGCSTRASPTRPPTTCSATSWHCWTPTRRTPAAPRRSPSGSSCCSPPASRPSSRRARRVGTPSISAASRRAPAGSSARAARRARSRSAKTPTASSSRRSRARWRKRRMPPSGRSRQADRAIAETLEHHAHVRLRRVA